MHQHTGRGELRQAEPDFQFWLHSRLAATIGVDGVCTALSRQGQCSAVEFCSRCWLRLHLLQACWQLLQSNSLKTARVTAADDSATATPTSAAAASAAAAAAAAVAVPQGDLDHMAHCKSV